MSGKAKFTIDDAFEDEGDDAVRSYGSTTESSALKGGTREECLVVRVEDDRTRRLRLPEDVSDVFEGTLGPRMQTLFRRRCPRIATR